MSYRDRIRARQRRRRAISRGGPVGDPTFWMSSRLLNLMSGAIKDPFAENPWVHRAIITIIDSLKSVQFQLYTGKEEDKKPVESGPWYEFLLSPSHRHTRREFWGLTWNYTQVGSGEAFWILFGKSDPVEEREIPVEAQVLPGSMFEAKTVNGRLDHWLFKTPGSGTSQRLELFQVVQFKPIINPDDPDRGLSPMNAALRDIRTDDKAARWNEALLTNGARPDGIITTDQDITGDQAKAIKDRWNDMHRGSDKAGKIGVLGHGAKWQDVTLSHTEMGFQSSREWARQVVGTAYGVPMLFLNVLDDVHKETSRTVTKQLWETNLIPKLVLAEDLLEARLFAGRGGGTDAAVWGAFDLTPIEALSDAADVRRDNALKDITIGMSRNEVNRRHDLGYEDQGPSGDKGLVPFNLQTVDAAAMTFDEIDEPIVPDDSALAPVVDTPVDQDVEVLEDLVLNGSQITSALNIVLEVVAGRLPRDSGLGMLETLFNLSAEQALKIMGSAGLPIPTTPNPAPETDADEPPSPPSTTTDDPEDVDEEGRAVIRRDAKRQAMWEAYIRTVQRPGEKKMQKRYTGWARGRIADTLRWLGKADNGRAIRTITNKQIDAFVASQFDRWNDMLVKQTKPVDTSIISDTLDRTGEQIGGLTSIDMSDPRITQLIAERGGAKIEIVNTMLKKRIRNTLVEGSANGDSIAQLQERVRAVGKVQASQAQTIARTESASASTQAKNEVMVAEGIEKHTWLTAGDSAERDSHAAIDGQTVKVGDDFGNGLKYPLDPSGPAEEVINCRCEAIPEV